MSQIMQLVNLELIDVEPILSVLFGGFRETDPFDGRVIFAELGYDTSNFFLECGPLMFIMMGFFIWAPIRKSLQLLSLRCNDNFLSRRLKKQTRFRMSVIRFFIESSVELSLSALITIFMMTE